MLTRNGNQALLQNITAPSYLQYNLLPDNKRTYNRSSLRNPTKVFATRTSTFRAIFSLRIAFVYCTAQKNKNN